MNEIVVLTPTYNREHTIMKLYESLKQQTFKNITWLIIDDGSNDGTEIKIKEAIEENFVHIIYIKQENGGKARALNNGFKHIDYDCLFVIVDSDDHLLEDGLENIYLTRKKHQTNSKLGGFFFHYTEQAKGPITAKKKLNKEKVLSPFDYFNQYGKNDGCLCYEKKAVEKYQYPEFDGEKYVGPTVLQMRMAKEYNILYSPIVVGVAEYQENGLTRLGRKLRINNPNGMIVYTKLKLEKEKNFLKKLKFAISIWAYFIQLNKHPKKLIMGSENRLLLIFTYLPGLYLNSKWSKN